MSGEFLGIFENSVNKQRVIIPASFKGKFTKESGQQVVVTIGPGGDNVAIYPIDNWAALKVKYKAGDERQRHFLTLLLDFACAEQKLEGPGRVKISEELLDEAGIKDSVIIKGEGDYISLWNPAVFKSKRKQKLEALKEYNSMDFQL